MLPEKCIMGYYSLSGLRVDNYDFDLKLLRLHRVCLFNPKGALLTFDFPQIS